MLINKIGSEHIKYGINNQDFGYEDYVHKVVVDGCSEGKHSEVGAKLFCKMFANTCVEKRLFDSPSDVDSFVTDIFNEIIGLIGYSNDNLTCKRNPLALAGGKDIKRAGIAQLAW